MKKSYFSLIELLVVIAIIAVLAGLLLPSIMSSQERARRTKAKADMNSLKIALKAVESTYGKMADFATSAFDSNTAPTLTGTGNSGAIVLGGGNSESAASWKAYDAFIKELSIPTEYTSSNSININKRKIKFLDYRDDGWYDPWGKPYIILLNNDYTGKIELSGKEHFAEALLYSRGPNMVDDGGKNPDNSPDDGVDDICGWEN